MIVSTLLGKESAIRHGFSEQQDTPTRAFQLKQVHSNLVHCIRDPLKGDGVSNIEKDAVMTACQGVCIAVRTADCLPILIFDPEKKVVAAVHAGWLGTTRDIAIHAVEALKKEYQCRSETLLVALGPCIQEECCEVGDDVFQAFAGPVSEKSQFLLPSRSRQSQNKWHLDLPRANVVQLQKAGVLLKNIDVISRCTYCDPRHFYSYRREKEEAGRQLSFIEMI